MSVHLLHRLQENEWYINPRIQEAKMREYLKKIEEVIAAGPYKDTWESLQEYEVPKWYRNAKFGIFIHWGVYSVPAFGSEWYPRNMYIQGSPEYEHHIRTYGAHKEFGYKDFIPMFEAENFDPAAWADLFLKAGAKYVVPVAEHHDGFQMYKSSLSHFNAYEMGPKRDVLGELCEEFDKRGMVRGASSHRIEHWFFMGHGKDFDSDVKEPLERGDLYWPSVRMENDDFKDLFSKPYPTEEFMEDWLVRTCELIDNYKPRVLWFDWWIQHDAAKPYLRKMAAYYYNRAAEWGIQVAINYKYDAFAFQSAVLDIERGQFADVKPYFWQTDTAIALNSWSYTENNQFRPAQDLVCDLVDIVSKNGCLLLNVGPKADGTITKEDTQILLNIGEWLRVNGEAIYNSKVWRTFGEGPTKVVEGGFSDGIKKEFTSEDIRYTVNGEYLYGTVLKTDKEGSYKFGSLAIGDAEHSSCFHGIIEDIEVLGFDAKPEWTRDEEALKLKVAGVESEYPVVFKFKLK